MGVTLYLLRRRPEDISSSLFQMNDAGTDIVFIQPVTSTTLVSIQGMDGVYLCPPMTYDDLIDRVFSAERTVVI
jgi:hypothetical protein